MIIKATKWLYYHVVTLNDRSFTRLVNELDNRNGIEDIFNHHIAFTKFKLQTYNFSKSLGFGSASVSNSHSEAGKEKKKIKKR